MLPAIEKKRATRLVSAMLRARVRRRTAGCDGTTSDEDLMRLAQADDVMAFGALYDRNAGLAWRLACSVCRDPARAEDVVQQAFVAAWRARMNYDHGTGSVRSWLMTIVGDRSRDSGAPHPPRAEPIPTDARAQWGCLELLPEAEADVIALAFYGRLTHREIAAQLSLPHATVNARMRLGLEKLGTQTDVNGRLP